MPQIKHTVTLPGYTIPSIPDLKEAFRRIERARPYQPVQTPALAAAMAGVGPRSEWAWLDYLSPGDAARVVRLEEVARATDTVADVRASARLALAEIRRVAEERMSVANLPA